MQDDFDNGGTGMLDDDLTGGDLGELEPGGESGPPAQGAPAGRPSGGARAGKSAERGAAAARSKSVAKPAAPARKKATSGKKKVAGKRGNGIQFRAQHGRSLGDKHLAKHAATNSCQHAQQRGHHRIEPIPECLLRADDSEKR